MKRKLLSVLTLLAGLNASAQYDYDPTGRNDAPVLGMQWGLTGGYYASMLPNRDDNKADLRLDPEMMNLNYMAGVEGVYWFQRNVGFGGQLLYWNGGAKYSGKDTVTANPNALSLSATTKLSYLKLPFLFHFKSYNRYYPNRRLRFNAMFGPYIAVLQSFSDEATISNSDINYKSTVSIDGQNYESNGLKAKINGNVYRPFDLGFAFGFGLEYRLWRRTVLALHLRADYSFFDIEDKRKRKLTFEGSTTDIDFSVWDNLYAKYTAPNALDQAAGFQANRPATKNFSAGAFLSLRKYFRQ